MTVLTAEQAAAVAARTGSRLLAANAGSGKTTVMVHRFVEAVLTDGHPVHSVLALTFTERAAAELRARVRARFLELGEAHRARETDDAWTGTIHSFCARLLRAHPFPAGLDPGFAVLDELAAARAAERAFQAALHEWVAARGEPAVELAAAYGTQELREMVVGAHHVLRSRGATRPVLARSPPPPVPGRGDLAAGHAAARSGQASARSPEGAEFALARCEELLTAGPGTVPPPQEVDLARLKYGARAVGSEACELYTRAWEQYRQACVDFHAAGAVATLAPLLELFAHRYAEEKRRRAAVDFDDLEVLARDLLRDHADVRARMAGRFAQVMVDEFQDTNRLQLELLGLLERDNAFAVGDELQSIYSFRHADVTVFRERRAELGPGGGVAALSTNFRSERALLDVVNACFAPVFGAAHQPLVAPDRPAPLEGPLVELLLTSLQGWEEHEDELGLAAPKTRCWQRAEARLVAQRLREELEAGARARDVVVLVRATASLRLLEQALEEEGVATYVVGGRGYWSQLPVRDGLAYLSVLANPLDSEALYGALAGPWVGLDAGALVVLAEAGAWAGGPWPALLDLAGGRAPWARGLEPGQAERLRRFAVLARAEREAAGREPADVLLERAIAVTGYDVAVLALPGGERRLANLRKLGRLAREHERTEGPSLRGFLAQADPGGTVEAREGEAPLESEDLDAVRLMTIHRAKGLEFPVVCLADLGRPPSRRHGGLLVGPGGRPGLRLRMPEGAKAARSSDYDTLVEAAVQADWEEERRLVYVAMTRAKQRLILSGAMDPAKPAPAKPSSPPLAWLLPALLGPEGGLPDEREPERTIAREWDGRAAPVRCALSAPGNLGRVLHRPRPAAAVGVPGAPAGAGEIGEAEPIGSHEPRPALPPRLSYTALAEHGRCAYRFHLQRGLGLRDVPAPAGAPDPAGSRPGEPVGALLRGTLAHELLEQLSFARPIAPDADVVLAAGAAHGVQLDQAQVDDLRALVAAFAGSSLCARLAGARGTRREAPFAFAAAAAAGATAGPDLPASLVVDGVVDVLAEEPGGLLVVDYKTDRLGDRDPAAVVAAGYAGQRLVYALAALRTRPERVDVTYCFLERPGEAVSAVYGAGDEPALQDELGRLMAGALKGPYPVAAIPHRELCGTCPGREALCSWPERMTLRPRAEAEADRQQALPVGG